MTPATKQALRLPGWLHDIVARHLEQDVELPVLPETVACVIGTCADETSDARALDGVIQRDAALAAHVLRVANSSAYAPKEPIVSLQQAASRLGLAAIQNVVLGATLQGRVFKVPGHQARLRAIWSHCAVTAAFARAIARKLRTNVEAAFLCGLLHDIGRPVVLQATVETLAHRSKEPLPGALLETAMDEFHEELGGRMVSSWKLADWTEAVVANHHAPHRAAPHEQLAGITLLADRLAEWAADGSTGPADFGAEDEVAERLGLHPEDVEALLGERGTMLAFAEALQ